MLIKINFVTENINYTEKNTENISGAGWNITADLKLVQIFILPGGPVCRILVGLYGRCRFCYQNIPITHTGLIPEVLYVLWLLLNLPSSFCSVYLSSSTLMAQNYTFFFKLPPHSLLVSIPHKPLVLMVSSKDPATYIVLTSSFLTL